MEELEKENAKLEIKKESNSNLQILPSLEDFNVSHIPQPPITKTKKTQHHINNDETLVDKILRLTGHQKAIFLFVVDSCIKKGAY